MQTYVHKKDANSARKHAERGVKSRLSDSLGDKRQHVISNSGNKHDYHNQDTHNESISVQRDSAQARPFYSTDLSSSSEQPWPADGMRDGNVGVLSRQDSRLIDTRSREQASQPASSRDGESRMYDEQAATQGNDNADVGEVVTKPTDSEDVLANHPTLNINSITSKYVAGDSCPDTTSGRLSPYANSLYEEVHAGVQPGEDRNARETTSMHLQHDSQQASRAPVSPPLPPSSRKIARLDSEQPAYLFNPTNNEAAYDAGANDQPAIATHSRGSVKPRESFESLEGFRFVPFKSAKSAKGPSFPVLHDATGGQNTLPVLATQRLRNTSPHRDVLHKKFLEDIDAPPQHARQPRTTGKQRAEHEVQGLYNAFKRSATPVVPIISEPAVLPSVAGPQEAETLPAQAELSEDDEELLHLDYNTLKSASFETHVKAPTFAASSASGDIALEEQLKDVVKLSAEDQAAFFSSLAAEEWENAGDWFVEQFADLVKKVKAARQEQRTVALLFQKEIDERHELVSARRAHTEDALREMKESGAKMLQGTPKANRTVRGE